MQYSSQINIATGASSVEVIPERVASGIKRTQLIISNTGATAITITKGNIPAVVGAGIATGELIICLENVPP